MNPHLTYLVAQERTAEFRRSARQARLIKEFRETDSTRERRTLLARFYILVLRNRGRSQSRPETAARMPAQRWS